MFCACLCERAPSEVGEQAGEVFLETAVPWKMGAPSELAAGGWMVAACEFVAGFCVVALERLALSIPVGSLGLELLADGGLSGQGQRDAVTWQFLEWHFGCCLRIGGKVVGLCSFGED